MDRHFAKNFVSGSRPGKNISETTAIVQLANAQTAIYYYDIISNNRILYAQIVLKRQWKKLRKSLLPYNLKF